MAGWCARARAVERICLALRLASAIACGPLAWPLPSVDPWAFNIGTLIQCKEGRPRPALPECPYFQCKDKPNSFRPKAARHRFYKFSFGPELFYKGSPRGLLKGYSRQAEFFAKVYRPEAAKRRLYKFGFAPKRFIARGRSGWLGGYRFELGHLVELLKNCLGPKPNLESRCLA